MQNSRHSSCIIRFCRLTKPQRDVYGRIDGYLKGAGMRIDPVDTQIAAIALVHNLTLVTHNIRHFSRVPNLTIKDWAVA